MYAVVKASSRIFFSLLISVLSNPSNSMIAFPFLNTGFSGHTIGLAGSNELLLRATDTPTETDATTAAITAMAVIFAAPLQNHKVCINAQGMSGMAFILRHTNLSNTYPTATPTPTATAPAAAAAPAPAEPAAFAAA